MKKKSKDVIGALKSSAFSVTFALQMSAEIRPNEKSRKLDFHKTDFNTAYESIR